MAANKFATMLHRNTHKLTVILVYAVLEWILIILLLLNSFFTYLITKFASYFGLKPPCLWCSRVDHMLEPGNNTNSYRDLVCETHATEISKLGYCSNHRRLVETQSMCMDCLASMPNHNDESIGLTRRIAFISWVSRDTLENGNKILRCSCCNESLNNNLYPPYLLFKPSWKALRCTQKGDLIIEAIDDDGNGSECKLLRKPDSFAHYTEYSNEIEKNDGEEHQMLSDVGSFGLKDSAEDESSGSESSMQSDEKEANEDQKAESVCITEQDSYGMDFVNRSFDGNIVQRCPGEDCALEIIDLHLERNLDCGFNRLIPIALIDSSTHANHGSFTLKEEDLEKHDYQNEIFYSSLQSETQVKVQENKEKPTSVEINMDDGEKSSVLKEIQNDLAGEACEQLISMQAPRTLSISGNIVEVADSKEPNVLPAQEEKINGFNSVDQTKSKPLEELDDQATIQPREQESTPLPCPQLQEDHFSTIGNGAEIPNASELYMHNEFGPNYRGKTSIEENMISGYKNQEATGQHSSVRSESNEAEEEKFPETPTSVDSFHYLHKKLLQFEKRESGTEESLDGSVTSEMEAGDPVQTVEKLKTALKAERKALNALYAELEEERSASAIAANQSMAMINRLQEEKAAMQMEALQYQRMMEEQSEYDQEALQLLNELIIKREREKQELEKELEVYCKKVSDYEAKEKIRMMRRSRDGSVRSRNSSATCSNAEDIDELSIDLNREARDDDGSINGNQDSRSNDTPGDEINLEEIALDCVPQISVLDDSLAEFEEERLSILDQLKALEEKLLALHENELSEDGNSVEHSLKYSVKGYDESYELSTPEENGISHELSKDKHYTERKTMGSMAKSLLPLLDAAHNEYETEEALLFEENVASEIVEMENPSSVSKFELESKKLALEEEVDHVYERLQALEADKEFLKHCMSSIKKGEKGMDLLQEILQHLRDLRAVELRVRNMTDDPLG
ncbi:hypothetical protein P3X46_016161 [Hevea brasiliensis]|uniref:GTD-binding domain-containing protein n=1 Tax=Hevea brasiliensis TaxID=3981 RepID=A0ABQ9M0I1_HEVBR|nr:myosin-binding protein 3 isoform X2 [Hevea brasiliensis]KAJ9172977.1 hypothetical protein P3X46_016161 [Hevea brasiliensis]